MYRGISSRRAVAVIANIFTIHTGDHRWSCNNRYNPKKIEDGACVVKFPTPAWSSPNLLNIAKFVESGLVFAHVRAASDGAALVGNVNHENTHPFKVRHDVNMVSNSSAQV